MKRYGRKTSKMPQKWGFSPICDPPRFFFKNRTQSLLYPYGALTSCKKLEKSWEGSLRYLKTDRRTTDGHGWLHRTPSDKPGVQNGYKCNKFVYTSVSWLGEFHINSILCHCSVIYLLAAKYSKMEFVTELVEEWVRQIEALSTVASYEPQAAAFTTSIRYRYTISRELYLASVSY